jgi:hypothetical protein
MHQPAGVYHRERIPSPNPKLTQKLLTKALSTLLEPVVGDRCAVPPTEVK